jgi:hypothetical protein
LFINFPLHPRGTGSPPGLPRENIKQHPGSTYDNILAEIVLHEAAHILAAEKPGIWGHHEGETTGPYSAYP